MEQEELKDIEIVCKTCGKKFIHNVRDQKFYKDMGYQNTPKYCRDCRRVRKEERNKFSGFSNRDRRD